MRAHGVTVSGASTAFYTLLYLQQQRLEPERQLVPTLRLLTGGGAPLPAQVYREFPKASTSSSRTATA
ncbi:hypothetical protein GCM10009836_24760 [Pseudonocardia ailaonensis]|uniref:Uncharacterized protein n=1 Tax=Pseudonocardia ailaonensis TaxID=367279 RepID=A0ABN2MYG0_9PSEU